MKRLRALLEPWMRGEVQLDPDFEPSVATVAEPGDPPAGVSVETEDGTTRVTIGTSPRAWGRSALPWALAALGFGALAYRLEPRARYLAAGMAAAALLAAFASRLARGRVAAEQGAVCLNDQRIWVERPQDSAPQWIEAARTVFAGAPAPDARAESLPLDSMPRSVVRHVRVETDPSGGSSFVTRARTRLVIEAEAGRMEYVGGRSDRKALAWLRDYLRYRLAKGI